MKKYPQIWAILIPSIDETYWIVLASFQRREEARIYYKKIKESYKKAKIKKYKVA